MTTEERLEQLDHLVRRMMLAPNFGDDGRSHGAVLCYGGVVFPYAAVYPGRDFAINNAALEALAETHRLAVEDKKEGRL